ncbi:MAG TPA: YebC/PmpR family DNA-binding transcriptional regulator [Candidatus Dormibacteraeota bacterium]|nr:YebC/PmpR family DNA-binding transcriptional regulator [Candidatus Dormibacteraeota bacterium]
MSGHSKWAGIKHKKAIVDAKRGQAFTRASREVTIAAKEGGSSPDGNFRLRLAIQKAREMNMPTDKIDAAIKRGTGELSGNNLEELRYEGYGPAGVAVMVDAFTDNRNRTSANMKHIFNKFGGNLGETNSVGWMFDRKGVLEVELSSADPDDVGLAAIEAGAEDVQTEGSSMEISTAPADLDGVRQAVQAFAVTIASAEVTMRPTQVVQVDEDRASGVLRLLEAFEEDEDVQQVYANFDIAADVLERISASV